MPEETNPLMDEAAKVTREYHIPSQIIEKWVEIPQSEYLNIKLTRLDLDNLYNSLHYLILGQSNAQQGLVKWSNGDATAADSALFASANNLIQSQNALRQLFTAIMASAISLREK